MLRCRFIFSRCLVSAATWPFTVRHTAAALPSARDSSSRSSSSNAGDSNTNSNTNIINNINNKTDNDNELRAARSWLANLHADAIPLRSIGELSFSRSSGPGGQNVNKVNSKATLRVPLAALLHHVPTALHGKIKQSRYVAAKASAMIVQADDSRKQSDNAHSCYRRLYEAIVEAGHHAVPNETSAEQSQRVKNLQKTDNERRLKSKKQQSSKKSSRRVRGDD